MAGPAKKRLGLLPCPGHKENGDHCGEPVMVLQSEPGTLHMACQYCGCSSFVKKDEPGHKGMLAKLGHKPEAKPEPTPAPTPAPAAPPKAPNSVFELGKL
jgi:hypothetical protein